MMEGKKKKNGADYSDRKIFTGIGVACLFGLFVLVYLFFFVYIGCGCSPPVSHSFDQTATSIIATNDRVATLISQTQVAATEQFVMTSTARP